MPHWAIPDHGGEHDDDQHPQHDVELPTPARMLETLFADNPALESADWTVLTNALIERPYLAPDGSTGTIDDSVLKLRRDR